MSKEQMSDSQLKALVSCFCAMRLTPLAAIVAVAVIVCPTSNVVAQGSAQVEDASLKPLENVDDARPAIQQAKALSSAFRTAASQVSPAVVTILVDTDEARVERTASGEIIRYYDEKGFDDSVGSGVVIHPKGFVLTNSHVVAGATRILVRLADKRELSVDRIKADKDSDVALLILNEPPDDLSVATLGNSDNVEIGDWVIAIGSPFEYDSTVSAGIISGKGRSLKQIRRGKLLQTDAAINPGNSGGPLVNLDGEVIGVNTAIASSSGGYQGIGFAIPSNQAKWVLKQLARYGKVRRAFLGVELQDLTAKDVIRGGLPAKTRGVLVSSVSANSPAAAAGLKPKDIIVTFGDVRIRDSRDLQAVVERQEAGTSHRIGYYRDGREGKVNVTVKRLVDDSTDVGSKLRYN